jgi:hypothetical protein
MGKQGVELQAHPEVLKDGETAEIEGFFELERVELGKSSALESGGDEFAQEWREAGDVANGAGARSFWSAEGFAHEKGGVSFAVLGGFGFLNKHGLQNFHIKHLCKAKKHKCYLFYLLQK